MQKTSTLAVLLLAVSTHAFAEAPKDTFNVDADASGSTYDWTGPYVGGFVGVSKGGNAPNPEFAYRIFNLNDPWNKGSEANYINNIY